MDYSHSVKKFRLTDFEDKRKHFENLGRRQNPHTLFIGCSDSRVVPSLITQSAPGELFIVRNIANIVPPYRDSVEFLSTTAAIEYAVQILNVKTIIVCGHSNCGGCAALYQDSYELEKIPHTRRWLELALPAKERVMKMISGTDHAAREWLTEQMNVVDQLNQLMTYPYIKERVDDSQIKILGWHYLIPTGDIYQYEDDSGQFELFGT
ncbi:MAG: carbonic anhydrase [Lentimicrobium sp.]|nr:carbonic anhydrase [Lentimicrobium sp.]